jgi:hypothetical protein
MAQEPKKRERGRPEEAIIVPPARVEGVLDALLGKHVARRTRESR